MSMTQEVRPSSRHVAEPSVLQPFKPAKESRARLLREAIETILLTLLVFAVVKVTIQPYWVDGPSMQPGLHTGELVIVNQLAYRFGSPQRGDVIVLHPPNDPSTQYIKRVIGLPGDTITITATEVYVDNTKLKEPYTYPLAPGEYGSSTFIGTVVLKTGQYFVMGDHRDISIDSRVIGAIPAQNIVGKAEFVLWPAGDIQMINTFPNVFKGVHR
jgi:signal peptidase I